MSKSYEATGKTREEAIDAGLEALGLTIGEVNVDVVEEGSKGLFGLFGSRPWRVRLTVIEQSSVLDTHSLFADSLEEKKPAPKKQPARKPQAEAPAKPAQEKPARCSIRATASPSPPLLPLPTKKASGHSGRTCPVTHCAILSEARSIRAMLSIGSRAIV